MEELEYILMYYHQYLDAGLSPIVAWQKALEKVRQ